MPLIKGKQLADNTVESTKVLQTGSTGIMVLAGDQTATDNKTFQLITTSALTLNNYATITQNSDAASKYYVDNVAAGLSWKMAARVGTIVALPANTMTDALTMTANANGPLPLIDGVSLSVNDRLLVKNETDPTFPTDLSVKNGLYYVVDLGSGGSPWQLHRTTDADNVPSGGEVYGGIAVFVSDGLNGINPSAQAGTGWVMSTPPGSVTLGTDKMMWVQFNGAAKIVAGWGIDINGNIISVDSALIATISTVNADVAAEASTRSTNDATILSTLDSFISQDNADDSTMQSVLQSEIDALQQFTTSTLESTLESEIEVRSTMDSTIMSTLASALVQDGIDDSEIQSLLQSELNSEASTRSTMDSEILSTLASALVQDGIDDSNIQSVLQSEIDALQQFTTSTLQSTLESEIEVRSTMDSTIMSTLASALVQDGIDDSNIQSLLQSELDSEGNTRSTMDSTILSTLASALVQDGIDDSNIQSLLQSEIDALQQFTTSTLESTLESEIEVRSTMDSTIMSTLASALVQDGIDDSNIQSLLQSELDSEGNTRSTMDSEILSTLASALVQDGIDDSNIQSLLQSEIDALQQFTTSTLESTLESEIEVRSTMDSTIMSTLASALVQDGIDDSNIQSLLQSELDSEGNTRSTMDSEILSTLASALVQDGIDDSNIQSLLQSEIDAEGAARSTMDSSLASMLGAGLAALEGGSALTYTYDSMTGVGRFDVNVGPGLDVIDSNLLSVMPDGDSIQVSYSGIKAAQPYTGDKNLVISTISGNTGNADHAITNVFIGGYPAGDGYIAVYVNGVLEEVAANSNLLSCYFSADGGITARTFALLAHGDQLIWNKSKSNYNLDTNDQIDLDYNVII